MKRKFVISVELDDELEDALYNIRWKHIDIEVLLEEELREQVRAIVRAYEEVV